MGIPILVLAVGTGIHAKFEESGRAFRTYRLCCYGPRFVDVLTLRAPNVYPAQISRCVGFEMAMRARYAGTSSLIGVERVQL